MQTTRRRLFAVAAAIAAFPAIALAGRSPAPLVLYGDGSHDDTDALRSLIAGNRSMRWSTGEPVCEYGEGYIHRRYFWVRDDFRAFDEIRNTPTARGLHFDTVMFMTVPLAVPHDSKKG